MTVSGATIPRADDEGRLALLAAEGDGTAFATLYDRYETKIFNFCARLTGSQDDAADATQDTFVKMLERLPEMKDRELNFGAYLFTVARHSSYRLIERRKRAEPTEDISELAGAGGGAAPPDPGDPDEDPERRILLSDQQAEIRAANESLPERQREVLAMRELDDMSYDDIAEVMDMNSNSVAQLISRARIRLRDELRGTTLSAIAVSSPECERALPLIAMQQDRQLTDAADGEWLGDHMATCETCRVSREAMQEAGSSYRAWVPVGAYIWLRQETIAKAAEAGGYDWSEHAHPHDGGGSAGPSAGGSGGAGAGFGGSSKSAPARSLGGKRGLARIGGVALLSLVLLLSVAGGLSEGKREVGPLSVNPASFETGVPAADASKGNKGKKRRHRRRAVGGLAALLAPATDVKVVEQTTPAGTVRRVVVRTGTGPTTRKKTVAKTPTKNKTTTKKPTSNPKATPTPTPTPVPVPEPTIPAPTPDPTPPTTTTTPTTTTPPPCTGRNCSSTP